MSQEFEAISLAAVGTTVACTTTASAAFAIPVTANNVRARFVRVQADGLVHVAFGVSTSVAATQSHPLFNANFDRIVNVTGFSHFSGLSRTASAVLNVTPVEF